jgi:antitoxin VapB
MTITRVFCYNSVQAVCLPRELSFPDNVKSVDVRAVGNELIVAPVGRVWDSFFLNGTAVTEDFVVSPATQV